MTDELTNSVRAPGGIKEYLSLARFDHATKHIFIIPGIIFALMLRGVHTDTLALEIVLGFITAVAIASANYTINEWLDRESDRHHPVKSQRASVQHPLSGNIVWAQWTAFIVIGMGAALAAGPYMAVTALIFALQGLVYNVPPVRSKDKAFLDVISESINNPLRLTIGWLMVDPTTLPPASILLAYWLGGAFLMAAKRYSEYKEIVADHGKALLVRYRASFAGYTEQSLSLSCFAYAMLSLAFLSIFLVKYRNEYILVLPVVVVLFVQYFHLAGQAGSTAQRPEGLMAEKGLMLSTGALALVFALTSLIDMPWLNFIAEPNFIGIADS